MSKNRYSNFLISEAKKLGLNESNLDKYYNRGIKAWVDHKVPGTTPEQLGLAVVEEFLNMEKERRFTIREETLVVEPIVESTELKKPSQLKESRQITRQIKLPDVEDETIKAWLEETKDKYITRYGDKASQKLQEAVNIFTKAKKKTIQEDISWSPPEEPTFNSKIGSKRYNWDMSRWHEIQRNNALIESNEVAAKYHEDKIREYAG